MNIRQWIGRIFAASAQTAQPAPARYEFVSLRNNNNIPSNAESLGFAEQNGRHPWVEQPRPPVAGVVQVPDLGFVAALFQSEAAEAEALYEMRKRGIKSPRPESNADSLR
ncbi:MAG: hypothetical protein ACLPTZ_15615 [Beijerinckiaceae bacterium]